MNHLIIYRDSVSDNRVVNAGPDTWIFFSLDELMTPSTYNATLRGLSIESVFLMEGVTPEEIPVDVRTHFAANVEMIQWMENSTTG